MLNRGFDCKCYSDSGVIETITVKSPSTCIPLFGAGGGSWGIPVLLTGANYNKINDVDQTQPL